MFIVSYEDYKGKLETFGPFRTYDDARIWMNLDIEYNINIANSCGEQVQSTKIKDGNGYIVKNLGSWFISPLY